MYVHTFQLFPMDCPSKPSKQQLAFSALAWGSALAVQSELGWCSTWFQLLTLNYPDPIFQVTCSLELQTAEVEFLKGKWMLLSPFALEFVLTGIQSVSQPGWLLLAMLCTNIGNSAKALFVISVYSSSGKIGLGVCDIIFPSWFKYSCCFFNCGQKPTR